MIRALVVTCSLAFAETRHPSCGVRALYTALKVNHVECELDDVISALPQKSEHRLCDLESAARKFALYPVMAHFPSGRVDSLPRGSVVHLSSGPGHFLVFLGECEGGVVLGDAPIPPYRLAHERFSELWTGNSLVLFGNAADAELFENRVRWQRRWFLVAGYVALASIATLVYASPFWPWKMLRRGRRRRIACRTTVLVCLLFAFGCARRSIEPMAARFPCELSPASPMDAGFVPPKGGHFEFTLRNCSDEEVVLTQNVKPSCGCTNVRVPDRIAARGTGIVLVELEGQSEPAARTTSFILETAAKQRSPVRLRFVTGALPCVTPYVIELKKAKASTDRRSAEALLWLSAGSIGRAELSFDADSALVPTVLDGDGYKVEAPRSLLLSRTGLIGLRLRLDSREWSEPVPAGGRGALTVDLSGCSTKVPYIYQIADESAVVLQPPEIMFLRGAAIAPQSRVVIVRGAKRGKCRILAIPPFLSADLHELSESAWKLVIGAKPQVTARQDAHEVAILWEASSGDKVTASLKVNLRGEIPASDGS